MSAEQSSGGLTEYIVHHLTHNTREVAGSVFHMDTWVISLALGLLGCFLLWTQARKATSGVPSKAQAFVELVVEFVDGQVKDTRRSPERKSRITPTSAWFRPPTSTRRSACRSPSSC